MKSESRRASQRGESMVMRAWTAVGKEEPMERVAIVARLKPGAAERARQLIVDGPPFELGESGIDRHSVFVSTEEVVFVFEGDQVERVVDDLIDAPFHDELQGALDKWRAIVEGRPRVARQQFAWERDRAETVAAGGETWA